MSGTADAVLVALKELAVSSYKDDKIRSQISRVIQNLSSTNAALEESLRSLQLEHLDRFPGSPVKFAVGPLTTPLASVELPDTDSSIDTSDARSMAVPSNTPEAVSSVDTTGQRYSLETPAVDADEMITDVLYQEAGGVIRTTWEVAGLYADNPTISQYVSDIQEFVVRAFPKVATLIALLEKNRISKSQAGGKPTNVHDRAKQYYGNDNDDWKAAPTVILDDPYKFREPITGKIYDTFEEYEKTLAPFNAYRTPYHPATMDEKE